MLNKKLLWVSSFIVFSVTQIFTLVLLYMELFRSNLFIIKNYSCHTKLLFLGFRAPQNYIFDPFCSFHQLLYGLVPVSWLISVLFVAYLSNKVKKDDALFYKSVAYLISISFVLALIVILYCELITVHHILL